MLHIPIPFHHRASTVPPEIDLVTLARIEPIQPTHPPEMRHNNFKMLVSILALAYFTIFLFPLKFWTKFYFNFLSGCLPNHHDKNKRWPTRWNWSHQTQHREIQCTEREVLKMGIAVQLGNRCSPCGRMYSHPINGSISSFDSRRCKYTTSAATWQRASYTKSTRGTK